MVDASSRASLSLARLEYKARENNAAWESNVARVPGAKEKKIDSRQRSRETQEIESGAR